MRIYRDLARWYPLITPAADYADEADHILRLIDAVRERPHATLLELGSGPGHMAFHLKKQLRCTLSDISPQMLDLSRALNPECTHVLADMRLLDLQDRFDVVLAQDAIGYMTTEADLKSAIATASRHLHPGGIAVLIPDHVKDTFAETVVSDGRATDEGRALRFLEWTFDPDPSDTTITVEFALMLREPGKAVRVEHDSHIAGLFDRATWLRLMAEAGLAPLSPDVHDPYAGQHEVFVGRRT
jgi:ubiquinone/menaquinone biosynthesis C-methylase UbiE